MHTVVEAVEEPLELPDSAKGVLGLSWERMKLLAVT